MEVDEKVELRCLRPKWVEPVLILCYHQGWDNRNDYIVRGIFPVAFVSVVSNEFQIFQIKKNNFTLHASQVISNAEDSSSPSTLSSLERTSDTFLEQTSRETYMTHWSMKRPTYLVQSDWYFSEISWCVCHTRSMSKVGTKILPGDEDMRSRKLINY